MPGVRRAGLTAAALLATAVLKVIACPGKKNVGVTVGPPGSGVHKHSSCRIRPNRRR